MLRALDYSWVSRHLLATAGDDGSVHMWDTTGRSPKVCYDNDVFCAMKHVVIFLANFILI